MYIDLHVKYPLFSPYINETLSFLDRFSKNTYVSNWMKIRPVGAELFHADGQTGRQTDSHAKANSRFSQFCERA
jgi:hypothetical protein